MTEEDRTHEGGIRSSSSPLPGASTSPPPFRSHPARGRVTWRRPSAGPSSSKATGVLYREVHVLLEDLADAALAGTRRARLQKLAAVPVLILDDLGMRKLPATAAEDLLELIMRRYERVSTLLTSNRPVEDWGKLLGDVAAVGALLDRLLHHAHVLRCGPRSWRMQEHASRQATEAPQ